MKGKGKGRFRATLKGRTVDPQALAEVKKLLGDREHVPLQAIRLEFVAGNLHQLAERKELAGQARHVLQQLAQPLLDHLCRPGYAVSSKVFSSAHEATQFP